MSKIRVAVLRGGPSSEYDVSLKTGASVLKHLYSNQEKYQPIDVLIDKSGQWHFAGFPHDPHQFMHKCDVVFNALHGEYGEDGKVQAILNQLGIPYTGSGALASSVAMNKASAKKVLKKHGIKTPFFKVFDAHSVTDKEVVEIFKTFPHPAVVKPLALGSSIGVSLVYTLQDLREALINGFSHSDKVMMEEYIAGKEVSCGVIDNFRNKNFYSLFPIEIQKPESKKLYDYQAKYTPMCTYNCPANILSSDMREVEKVSAQVHDILGLKDYSRSDFIISPRRGIYWLEVNTLPGLTENSLFPKSLRAVGSDLGEFVDHLLALALRR